MVETMETINRYIDTKRGDNRICSSNRSIALISHASNVIHTPNANTHQWRSVRVFKVFSEYPEIFQKKY